jgi:hypothetical protein
VLVAGDMNFGHENCGGRESGMRSRIRKALD